MFFSLWMMPGLEALEASTSPVSCPINSVDVMPDKVSWSNRVKVVVDRRGKELKEELDTKLSRAITCLLITFSLTTVVEPRGKV